MSRLTAAAEGEPCVRCGSIGTTVSCHYSGLRQHAYGKGRGCKGNDLAAADLCHGCHGYFDSYETPNDWERSEEFLHCCMLTILRPVREGDFAMKDEAGGMPCHGGPVENTDRHLWPQVSDDYYAPRIHVTKEGNIGIDVGGHVFVKPLREWHELAKHASKPITKDEARKLLDEYDNEVFELRASGFVSPHYLSTVQSVLDAMTHSETIAEQQREIERLMHAIERHGAHIGSCMADLGAECHCGLDEVLK